MKRTVAVLSLILLNSLSFAGGTLNRYTLSNGLSFIHSQNSENPLVTIQVFLRNGVSCETKDVAGISSFTQVMMQKGTGKRSSDKLSVDLENIGAVISIDTEHDFCSMGISAMNTHAEDAAEILSDVITGPSFDKSELEKERSNVLAGIKARQDSIHATADDLFIKTFYSGNPYSWPECGTKECVEKFTRKDLLSWYNGHYVSRNMLVVIAGDISLEDAKKLSQKYFSGVPDKEMQGAPFEVKETFSKNLVQDTKKFQQAYFMIGFPAPSVSESYFPVLKVLNAYTGSRMSGKLFVELREKLSLAYEVNSFYPSHRFTSRFMIYLGLKKQNVELAKKRIFEILDELRKNEISEKEVEETKNYIKGVYLLDHQTVARQAWYLGWWEVLGKGSEYDQKYIDDLMKVSPQDVKDAVNRYLNGKYTLIEILPDGKK
jgi:predicted Zn-dependent peptidase